MQKHSIHLAMVVFAIACCSSGVVPSTAEAACPVAKYNAVSKQEWNTYALLKKTKDCSYISKIMALEREGRAIGRIPGCNGRVTKSYAQLDAELRKLCRATVAETSAKAIEPPIQVKGPPTTASSEATVASKSSEIANDAPPAQDTPGLVINQAPPTNLGASTQLLTAQESGSRW